MRNLSIAILIAVFLLVFSLLAWDSIAHRVDLLKAQTDLAIVQQNNIILRHRLSMTPAYLDSIACTQARRIADHEKRIGKLENDGVKVNIDSIRIVYGKIHKELLDKFESDKTIFSSIKAGKNTHPFVLCTAQDGSWYSTLDSLIYSGITSDIFNSAHSWRILGRREIR